jgi:hypothetical protein
MWGPRCNGFTIEISTLKIHVFAKSSPLIECECGGASDQPFSHDETFEGHLFVRHLDNQVQVLGTHDQKRLSGQPAEPQTVR